MMNLKYLVSSILLITFINCKAQPNLKTEEWRADLAYLQNLIDTQYEPLYYKISKEEFHKAVDDLNSQIPQLETNEIIVGIAKLLALFGYGHTGMPLFQAMHGEEINTGFHTLPLNFYHFSDGVFIQGVQKEYAKALGAKVLMIGDKTIDEALSAIRPIVSIENEQFFKAYGIYMLSCPEVLQAAGIIPDLERMIIKLSKDGKEFEMELPTNGEYQIPAPYGLVENSQEWLGSRKTDATPSWLKDIDQPYAFEYQEANKTVYVRQSQVRNGPHMTISQFYKHVFDFVDNNPVDKFILDVRQNGGGDNHLNKPLILGLIKSKVNQEGKLFTIIGRRTFSAAQNLVNELEKFTETIFIGEPTSENVNFFGDVKIETLPNSKLNVRLSYLWWQDLDPRDTRLETSPKVFVDMSSEEYVNNIDPVLDAALNYVDPRPEIIRNLKAKFDSKEFDVAGQIASAYLLNPEGIYDTSKFESQLNTLGYDYINDEPDIAIAVFKLNTQLFSLSPNAWDSLAESYLNASDFNNAIKYYQKAYEMDKNGPTGRNAKDALDRIKMHMGN